MDFNAAPNTLFWSSCLILLGKFAGVHGLEWHECDAFEAPQKKNDRPIRIMMADFFGCALKAPHSCHSSSRTPTIFPKKNTELQYDHMDYGFMDRRKFIFWHMIWMDGFWGCAKKQRGVSKK